RIDCDLVGPCDCPVWCTPPRGTRPSDRRADADPRHRAVRETTGDRDLRAAGPVFSDDGDDRGLPVSAGDADLGRDRGADARADAVLLARPGNIQAAGSSLVWRLTKPPGLTSPPPNDVLPPMNIGTRPARRWWPTC